MMMKMMSENSWLFTINVQKEKQFPLEEKNELCLKEINVLRNSFLI